MIPFFWGAKPGLLPDLENNSAKTYLGNSPRGSYRVFGKSPPKKKKHAGKCFERGGVIAKKRFTLSSLGWAD